MASSQYLSAKTSALTNVTPISPSQARAAQIPLQSFTLPTFPPEAFTSGLDTLILTSDIKPSEYTDQLTQSFAIPALPASIKSLTLELFSLGYPPNFLVDLGKALPPLKSLTLYSQLLFGTTAGSQHNAIAFLYSQSELQEVHLLDVYGPPEFFAVLAGTLSPRMKFLEVNYTFRHEANFLSTLPMKGIEGLVKEGLVALTLSISSPGEEPNPDGGDEAAVLGILPIIGQSARNVAAKLLSDGGGLAMVDVTMFEFNLGELESILDGLGELRVVSVTVGLESGWEEILKMLETKDRSLEVLEIVGVPGEGMVEGLKKYGPLLRKEDIDRLAEKCKALKVLKVSVLRTRSEHWTRSDGLWEMKA
jgi:hypothetical protein